MIFVAVWMIIIFFKKLLRSEFAFFNKLNNGDIKENITNIFDLKDASLAHTELQSRSTTGSIIFKT